MTIYIHVHIIRKLAERGYKRSAKKCKEKFENVQKYYKRTKEGHGGRQDGKSYKFFTQLEALNQTAVATSVPTSSHRPLQEVLPRIGANLPPPPPPIIPQQEAIVPLPPPDHNAAAAATGTGTGGSLFGISFSSNSSSSSDDEEEMEMEVETESTDNRNDQRKRKRRSHADGRIDQCHDERMMDFFEGLLKQVMQKQEAMQQRFLEAIEKREQDRMIREEAWKRQDMARLAREHDLIAQERAISASRDAAIIAFLQKITGQTIHLPTALPPHQNPPPPPHQGHQPIFQHHHHAPQQQHPQQQRL